MASWYLLREEGPLSAEENMARDEFLFRQAEKERVGFLRIYSWRKPSFSFGVSQRIERAVNIDYIKSEGLSCVRRLTGGKTVLHNDEITYAVISSEEIFFKQNDLYRSYLLIARVLLNAFKRIGIAAVLSNPQSNSQLARSSNPCFSFPTPNEIEVNGKKIAGSAQKRNNRALLQHGSIPYSMNFELYARGANFSADQLSRNMTSVSAESSASKEELAESIVQAMSEFVGTRLESVKANFFNYPLFFRLLEKYCSAEWNERAEYQI